MKCATVPSSTNSSDMPRWLDLARSLFTTAFIYALGFSATGLAQPDFESFQRGATTESYRQAALKILLTEATQIAVQLDLPERLPIDRSSLLELHINTPFWADATGAFGSVSTSNYTYYASLGGRLAWIDPQFGPAGVRRPGYMESLRKRYLVPKGQMDTNAAYSMATQWLARAGMDVKAIERDAERIKITAWEIGSRFVPVYLVNWQRLATYRGDDGPAKLDSIAFVEFLAPERRILQMRVNVTRYVKREPLSVPNRDSLLSQSDDPQVMALWSTTKAYQDRALRLMLNEMNWAAKALGLKEGLPIETSSVVKAYISTPYSFQNGSAIGTLYTTNYRYTVGEKFLMITRPFDLTGEDPFYLGSLKSKYTWPTGRFDTTVAYTLATQWLASISVDVKRLEADYPPQITVPWNLGDKFVPLYQVKWARPIRGSNRKEEAAIVEVLEPERSLEQLIVLKREYMDRRSLNVQSPDRLLPEIPSK